MKENGITHWSSPNVGTTNQSDFSALPSGCRHAVTAPFANIGMARFTHYNYSDAWGHNLNYDETIANSTR